MTSDDVGELRAELARLRKLFDDAGQGEHNVLALIDHYQRSAMEAEERLREARAVLELNGCECNGGDERRAVLEHLRRMRDRADAAFRAAARDDARTSAAEAHGAEAALRRAVFEIVEGAHVSRVERVCLACRIGEVVER